MSGSDLLVLSRQVGNVLLRNSMLLALAESCTGGWVAQTITDVAGSSDWFDRAYVCYSNSAKIDMLGVFPQTLHLHGAVSEAVVREMADAVLIKSGCQIAAAVSGIAGPEGGSPDKPVGLVWLAWAVKGGGTSAYQAHYAGDRRAVRRQTVVAVLEGILTVLEERLRVVE